MTWQQIPGKSFGYDEDYAIKVKDFIEDNLVFTTGIWAGQPFRLMDWQWEKVIAPLFGTLKYPDGPRQYRTCYIEIGKKNGKTELSAAIMLYMLVADGEKSPMCFSAASTREQASLIFRPAAYMVENNPEKFDYLKVLRSRKRIVNYRDHGFYQVLSSDVPSKHGENPSFVAIDELHAHKKDELFNVLTSGTDYARAQQIILITTTAGVFDKNSIWWRKREKARQIDQGLIIDDTFHPVLFLANVDDDPANPKTWKKANPSIGTIFNEEKIEEDYNTVKDDPIALQDFKRYRCNIPIRQKNKWLPMDKWDACAGKIDEAELKGRLCYGGLDGSTRIDLTAFVLVFPPKDDDIYIILPYFFIPEETIMRRSKEDKVHYEIWADKGLIIATPGNIIDHRIVKEKIVDLSKNYNIEEIGYDAADITQMANELQDNHNLKLTQIVQTYGQFNEPAQDFYSKLLNKQINHGGHEVLRWCADNLVMKIGLREKVLPDKSRAIDRIDGIVALFMAWKQMMFGEKESGYEEMDLKVI